MSSEWDWQRIKDQHAVDHLGRTDHGKQEGDHPDVVVGDNISLRVQHGIVEMFRYLFPEEFDGTDNPVLDHEKWEPGSDCFEWDSGTIEEIADTIRHLYGIAMKEIKAASKWQPADWARQLLETIAERLCDEDITDGSQYNSILAELYEWWEVVECEGDWDMFGGGFCDSIERAFLLQRKKV